MSSTEQVRLSSKWTNLNLYAYFFCLLALLIILVWISKDLEFHIIIVFFGLVLLIIIGLIAYQFMYICNAYIVGEKLILKKQFRAAKSYSIHKIGSIHSVYISSDKYTTVQMKNEDKSLEKYIILSNESLFSKTIDPEEMLILLRDTAMYEKE
ncbi:hypothetical protein M4I21_12130 [Cellulophaga sp. 20_2_10]|uniref:hypothetical protein n=1 Tax=Cellulophaga sp. 20_2_10 TaxID=2942476 RepID=UPI00201A3165|nr:hypothetical protein [Cellulophaga sp. 20_2_10]MCL5246563.1 hypothetical protein [Cellulophaga sp. 20_2_10]